MHGLVMTLCFAAYRRQSALVMEPVWMAWFDQIEEKNTKCSVRAIG